MLFVNNPQKGLHKYLHVMKKYEKKSVEKNYIYNLVYQMLVVAIPLLTTPYISHVLNAGGVGTFSYATAITGYFILFGNLGIATFGQLKIAALRNDKYELSKIFYELFLLRVIMMGCILVLYIGFIHIVSNSQYRKMYFVLIVQIIASLLDISWFLQGLEEFKKIVIRNTVIKLLSVVLIFSFVKNTTDLYLYAFIINTSTLLGNLSIWFFVPRFLERVRFVELKPMIHMENCLMYFIPTAATMIYLTLDKIMIGWFTTTSFENGYYEQAHKIEQMAVTVITSLSIVTMPRMVLLFKNKEIDKLKQRLNKTIKFILFISIPMCSGMIAVSDYFIPLFLGEEFNKSIYLLRIFSILLVIVGLNNAVGKQVLMPIGRQKKYNMGVIVGAIVNFALNLLLIPHWLSIGAAIASVTSETVILFVFIYNSRDYIKFSWILKSSIKYIIASAVMFFVIRISYNYLEMNWKNLIIQIVTGIFVYSMSMLILRDKFL